MTATKLQPKETAMPGLQQLKSDYLAALHAELRTLREQYDTLGEQIAEINKTIAAVGGMAAGTRPRTRRTGNGAKIIERATAFLKGHPNATTTEIAAAVGEQNSIVLTAFKNSKQIVKTVVGPFNRYNPARWRLAEQPAGHLNGTPELATA